MIGLCIAWAFSAHAAAAESVTLAPPLHPSPAFTPSGPAGARGALVWLHGSYDTDLFPTSPAEPLVIRRFATLGWDIWRFDRTSGRDPLAPGGEALATGLRRLRAAGYAHMLVAGHSRGAFIALFALHDTSLADGYLLLSPAAHGSRPERRPQAIADFSALLDTAAPAPNTRIAIAQFTGDTLDPDPARRRDLLLRMARRTGIRVHSIFLPRAPNGHMGAYDGDFDVIFGEQLAKFLTPGAQTSPSPQAGRSSGR